MYDYDVAVIGGGPAGFSAAMRAVGLGKRVLLIEKDRLGGNGVFNGALSSKTLWEISFNYRLSHHHSPAYQVKDSSLYFQNIIAEKNAATHEKERQLQQQVNFMVEKGWLNAVKGSAKLISAHTISVDKTSYSAETIVLATGSRPRHLPSIKIDEERILTSNGIENLKDFPGSMVILGAGVIGCEYATIFSNFGKTRVSIIDKQNRILPFEDEDIVSKVRQNFEQNGINIHAGSDLKRLERIGDKVEYEIVNDQGQSETYTVDCALISIGRVPNVEDLGLQEVGVACDKRGYIEDDDCQTSVPNIYAVGDITADIALVNVAELEGRHAIEKAYGLSKSKISYDNISSIMFLRPEVAAVGLNEMQARQNEIAYRVASIDYSLVSRAMAMRRTQGMFKILVSDDDEMRILGMRVVGPHASSTIQAVSVLVQLKKGIHAIAETVHAHPSMPEGIQECARILVGSSVLSPDIFGHKVRCVRVSADGKVEEFSKHIAQATLENIKPF